MWDWLVENKDILESLFYIFSIFGLSIWGVVWAKGTVFFKTFILYFKRFRFLFSDEFRSSLRVAKCLYDLDDCRIWINKDVIGDTDGKDYLISPMQLTIICNVIENYCHCGNKLYNPKNYYDYLHYIRTGKNKNDTLDERRISALKMP